MGTDMANILFFAPDLSETAQLRRIRSFARAGHKVGSVSMRKSVVRVDWPDLDLGQIANEQLGRRLRLALRGLVKLWAYRRQVALADLIIARNIDMVLLALAARFMAGRRVPVVYECLDIHGIFTGTGRKARIARWVERFALTRVALLVVSSPGFIAHYFGSVQGYRGRWFLLENKLWFPGPPLPRPAVTAGHAGPLVLGWVGAIRCQPSLDLLCAVAETMGNDLRIEVRGVIHTHALNNFQGRIAAHPNIHFGGPYDYPDGLAQVYGDCDLVWAQDLWQRGANSDWLLPNRIYEASWFGCPSIAVAGTQTAAKIEADGLGYVIDAATPEAMLGLLQGLTREKIAEVRNGILGRPDADFALADAEINAVVALGMT
jgi:succinoglycan biosynthesis protein ExoL